MKARHRFPGVLACCFLAAGSAATQSADETSTQRLEGPPTGIYSSLAASEWSGDLVGLELFVLRGATGHFAVIQGSEGAPGDPITVPLQINGNSIRFSIPGKCACALPEGIYEAQLSRTGARLRGPGTFGERQLPRTASFWQRG